jgi:aspartate racemase
LTKHIGIVAVSPEGAALCYRQLFRAGSRLLAPALQPRVSLHNEPLARYIAAIRAQDWHAIGDLLRRSAEALARCGAEFCFSPDNAVQHGVHLAEVGSPIPWLTMNDLVARAVERDGRRCVGLIGTKMVTTGSTYQTYLGLRGIHVLAPDAEEAEALDAIIYGELIYGNIQAPSQRRVLAIIERLAERGCDGVILGCSEAPLLVTPENSKLPIYDAADILAEGAVRHAAESSVGDPNRPGTGVGTAANG